MKWCRHATGLVLGLVLTLRLMAESPAYEVRPLDAATAEAYRLDRDFFAKTTAVHGILIATSPRVSDHAHRETAYLFDRLMSALQPRIAERIRDGGVLCILVGHDELTSDIPFFATEKTGDDLAFYNWRHRGFLTRLHDRPTVLFAEENVLEYEGGMRDESILIHEFGHVIHRPGFYPGLDEELMATWQAAQAAGLWQDARAAQRFRRVRGQQPVLLLDALVRAFPEQPRDLLRRCLDGGDILVNGKPTHAGVQVTADDRVLIVFGGPKACYAMQNRGEYFAEMVQAWFHTNRTMDHDHNHIHTRPQLKAYDPAGARFLAKIFKDEAWHFLSPRERAGTGHLADYDPATAPVVRQPDFLLAAANDYYDDYWSSYWSRLRAKHGLPAAPAAADDREPEP